MNQPIKTIIKYLVWRIGAEKLARYIIERHMEGYHLARNPKKRVCDEVMETRISR